MAEVWRLRKNNNHGKIGEAEGKFEDYFRRLQSEKEAYEIRCVTGPFSETVLVYNPIAQIINETPIYACVVLWKDYKTREESAQNILIGGLDEVALFNNQSYFNILMGKLLKQDNVRKRIADNEKPKIECNNYIGSINDAGNGIWDIGFNPDLAMACAESDELPVAASFLGMAIHEHQQNYEHQHTSSATQR